MITKYENICAICGRAKEETHHLVFGRGLRQLADEDKLTIPLCHDCHSDIHMNGTAAALSKMLGQIYWEKEHPEQTREDFRKRYGRSWL